ncbi:group II intron reverse transcriptase/maturase [Eubacteriales bacterium OttesenSCG-928-K08]|nr:group II intron reverse transcriptase/maturase [Eubacteriales bacterium OttesenSCG-928-K08]
MKPTIEILENVKQNSVKNENEVFTRLYRYMLRPDLYFIAYKNLYANSGAATKGIDNDTADGFSEEKINRIIKKLADESYMPKPARRTYIEKSKGKKRPLGIPTFTDKLVQEVLRMILESVYEPVFLDCSHGFRPNKSCHTALKDLKHQFHGTRWFVEGDIKGCFDNIDHHILVGVINAKIKDARIIKLIWKLLKAGYMENWQYHATYSGTPQGGIISPLFANIYLHELDKFVAKLAKNFDRPRTQKYTDEYDLLQRKVKLLSAQAGRATGDKKRQLLAERKIVKAELLKTPSKSQTDKKIKYIRYADDFIIGVNGSKEDCVEIKRQLSEFIAGTLKMELSEEKTLITHSNNYARFLGYDVRVRRNNGTVKPAGPSGHTKRTLNNMTELAVPLDDKIMKFLFEKCAIRQVNGVIKPLHRKHLLHCTELEIISSYNAELRGICNYYSMASNFYKLQYFAYLMECSCLKTLAAKHKCSTKKIRNKYKDGKGEWGIPYETKNGMKRCYFAKYMDCKKTKMPSDKFPKDTGMHRGSITSFESRLAAKECELCGTTTAEYYEIHHVHKIKDLEGKKQWERVMISKRRKTMVLCKKCHYEIHDRVLKTEQ